MSACAKSEGLEMSACAKSEGLEMRAVAATVAGTPVPVSEVDAREARLRASRLAAALPPTDTSEGRQLRRWLTQLIVAERVVAAEAQSCTLSVDTTVSVGTALSVDTTPTEEDLMPDTVARMELGSIAASILEKPVARALFATVTADVTVAAADVAAYHARNPRRFACASPAAAGWRKAAVNPSFEEVRPAIVEHLLAAARRREFRRWLDGRVAAVVDLAPGYEHPGDPRQPDNTHRH